MINPENITAGLCSQTDSEIFIPENGRSNSKMAKAICRRCVEIKPCLIEVMDMEVQPPGVWAGLSKRERNQLKAKMQKRAS